MLGVSQIIGYGTLYYAYAILAQEMAREFGSSLTWVFGVLSVALLAGGAISPLAGRLTDRCGAGTVMVYGSVAAALSLLILAASPNATVFVIGVVALELASPFVQYNAAFAYLARGNGGAARRRIVHLTLIAGFASTIFWPLTAALLQVMDWRGVYATFALLNLLVALPLHLRLRTIDRQEEIGGRDAAGEGPVLETPLPVHLHRRALGCVTVGFALSGFLFSAISTQMVPLLASLGTGAASVLVASFFGPAQVLVRFVNMAGGAARHPIEATLAAAVLLPLATIVLAITAPAVLGAAAFVILLGFGSGLTSIVRGTLPLALFGRAGYGARLGRISAAQLASSAAAPVVLSSLVEFYGPGPALGAMAVIGAAGFVAFLSILRLCRSALAGT